MADLVHFFRHRWAELLIAGVWMQSVIAAAFTGSLLVFVVATLGGLLLLVAVFALVGWIRSRRRPAYGIGEAFGPARQAVVLTLGRQKSTTLLVLQKQQPAWVGLICSRDTESVADEIAAQCGLGADHVQKEIVDPWNVVDIRRQTASLLDWLAQQGVDRESTVVDITGGTAIMSVGAFSVADDRQVDCQYVRSDYDLDNKVIPGSQRGVFVTRYERIKL